ncbi:FAD dependent oxidoreductase [Auriscalpium vulgare]|uniref:FAD dependent oxidoreductase n=1 Tax=Auriscalpium vulgare TaxID=40419 RepID=A0ACB8R1W7_9AGAM|nr:FAD dependent oxidoreductase [Auriscalpium vulgare]
MATPKNIVVVGAGIIGTTTAFYLSRHPSVTSSSSPPSITIIEASQRGAAQGASGKAGGLVAKWAYPKELTDVSFKQHVALSAEFDGSQRWGWRWVDVGEWEGRGREASGKRVRDGLPADLSWVSDELTEVYTPLAQAGDTAQVHPRLFTQSMLDLALENGVRFVQGRVTTLESNTGHVSGVRYVAIEGGEEVHLPADRVVLAAGAWSSTLLPSLPVSGTRAHSVVIRAPLAPPAEAVSPYVLFTSIELPKVDGGRPRTVSPEIYPRPDATIYVCGPGDTRAPLPLTVDDVAVDAAACEEIWDWVAETGVIEEWALGDIETRQACYLPTVDIKGGPIIGAVPNISGLVAATGHTCWGICNAPGTAKAVSELVLEGSIKCADLSRLDAARFI